MTDSIQVFLKQEADKALARWRAAEEAQRRVTDPRLAEFAAYDLEAAKKKYLYILHMLKLRQGAQQEEGACMS